MASDGPVLLYGYTGYFGSHMLKHLEAMKLPHVLGKARLEDRPGLIAEIKAVNPRYIICAAGLAGTPNIDWCETHKQETIRVNVVGTLNIADAAFTLDKRVAVFGSGCIYEYDATHPLGSGIGFTEEEAPNFQGSFYVKTRVLLEPLATQYPNLLYLRVRFPISDDMNSRSVLSKLINYDRVVNVPNSFTVLDDLLPLVPAMMDKGLTGLINLVNPGVISHNELLQYYKDYIDPEFTWKNFTVEEQARILAAGRSNNELSCAKLLSYFPDVPEIHKSMDALFGRMKAAGIKPRPRAQPGAAPAPAPAAAAPLSPAEPARYGATGTGPVLLYGSTGYFGSHMLKHLERNHVAHVLGKARLEDRPALMEEIKRINPSYVICAAGLAGTPNIDWCETHKQETIRVNVVGTLNIADVCYVLGKHCSVFGSGCIYEYDAAHPMGSGIGFTEEEAPNFQGSFYVKTRVLLEPLATQYPNLLYLRVRFPISDDMNSRSVLSKLIGYERVVNVPNSFTVLDDLLPLVPQMADKGLTGLINLVNPGVISHNELLQYYKDYIDPEFTWKNFTVEEQAKVLAAGRSNNELSCAKLLSYFPDVPEIHKSMDALFGRMKAAGIKPRPRKTA